MITHLLLLPLSTSFLHPFSLRRTFNLQGFDNFQSLDDFNDLTPPPSSEIITEDNLPSRLILDDIFDEHDGNYLGVTYTYDEESIKHILDLCRITLETLFGYSVENRGVGITGSVEYVGLEGPVVVIPRSRTFIIS